MGRLTQKDNPKEDAVMQWHTQVGITTANIKVKIDFTLPELSATQIMMWNCHVDDSANDRYDMILDIDILTSL